MFRIYTDNILMYDDTSTLESLKVVSPKLSLSQSSAGTFTMTVPPGNAGYDHLDRLTSWIRIFKGDQEVPYWEGRILSETTDFWNCKQITCEGILGVLNDTIQPPNYYQNQSIRTFLTALLNVHNSKVENWKKIYVGTTEGSISSNHRYTNYESTLECINDKLLEKEGGYIQLRTDPVNGKRYLDYLVNYPAENAQKIEFGKNLLDFSKSFSSEDFCTVLVPRGAQLEEGDYDALVPYVDVSSVNGGSIYVTLTNADFQTPPSVLPVDEFGWIEAVHDWEDVEEPANLLSKAKAYLKDIQFDNMELTVNALDMRYAGAQYEEINLNDSVRVVSAPHGLDRLFPVTKLDIPLDSPESTQFTLGTSVKVSLTHRNNDIQNAIKNEIAQLPTEQKITEKAKSDAADLLESAIKGYVTIVYNEETGSQELVISTTPNYLDPTAKIWRWNANGLGYSPNGYNSGNYTIAITSNGAINADFVSTGALNADLITAGILRDQVDGTKFYLNLENGDVSIGSLDTLTTNFNNFKTQVEDMGTRNYLPAVIDSSYGSISNCSYTYDQNSGKYVLTATAASSDNFTQVAATVAGASADVSKLIGEKMILHADSIVKSNANCDPRVYVIFTNSSGSQVLSEYIDPTTLSKTVTVPTSAVRSRIVVRMAQTKTAVAAGNTLTVIGAKLEKGEIATDWTPAPEDEASIRAKAISAEATARVSGDEGTITSINSIYSSKFEKYDNQISTALQEIQNFPDGARNIFQSEFQQTAQEYTMRFQTIEGELDGINDNLAAFRFSADGLEIKGTRDSASGSSLELKSDKVSLKQNGTERLWLTADGANAQSFNATNSVVVNDFIWERYPNGFRLRK